MERLDPAIRLPDRLAGGALALGNFDGVHIGHQAVIRAAVDHAHKLGRPALVATFEPHPSLFFRPDSAPFALTTTSQKLDILAGIGVDAAMVIPFNQALAALPAEDFARIWLGERLRVAHVVTGEDFHFGKGRGGRADDLPRFGRQLGFTASALKPVDDGFDVVSSTRIREALQAGDPREAARLLSRPFAIAGEVVGGQQLGRTIGVPTANQRLGPYQRPRYGVYAVRVRLPDGSHHAGVANLGIRPMFDLPQELLESWIFDWSGDLYGQNIAVELIDWIRPELKLPSLGALRAQIAHDAAEARRLLGSAARG